MSILQGSIRVLLGYNQYPISLRHWTLKKLSWIYGNLQICCEWLETNYNASEPTTIGDHNMCDDCFTRFTSLWTSLLSCKSAQEIQLRRFISAPRYIVIFELILIINFCQLLSTRMVWPLLRFLLNQKCPLKLLSRVALYLALTLTLQLRTNDLYEEDCKRLRVTELWSSCWYATTRKVYVRGKLLNHTQLRLSSRLPSKRLPQYPRPIKEMQPPNLPLLDLLSFHADSFGYTMEGLVPFVQLTAQPGTECFDYFDMPVCFWSSKRRSCLWPTQIHSANYFCHRRSL